MLVGGKLNTAARRDELSDFEWSIVAPLRPRGVKRGDNRVVRSYSVTWRRHCDCRDLQQDRIDRPATAGRLATGPLLNGVTDPAVMLQRC